LEEGHRGHAQSGFDSTLTRREVEWGGEDWLLAQIADVF
jgi:hypothetical protein